MTKSSTRKGGKPRSNDWKSPTALFAARLAKVRDQRGLTQRELADRLKQLGHVLPAEQISRIETRKRGVSLDDAFALAYALDCSLVHLLVDPDAGFKDPQVVVVGNVQPEQQPDLRAWVSGDGPLMDQDPIWYARQRSLKEIAAEMEAVKSLRVGDLTTPQIWALREWFERTGDLPRRTPRRKEEQ